MFWAWAAQLQTHVRRDVVGERSAGRHKSADVGSGLPGRQPMSVGVNLCLYVEPIPSFDPSGCYDGGYERSMHVEAAGERAAWARNGRGHVLEPIPGFRAARATVPMRSEEGIHASAVSTLIHRSGRSRGRLGSLQVSRSVRLIAAPLADVRPLLEWRWHRTTINRKCTNVFKQMIRPLRTA